jgi:nucleotide-binding universal stress UspA family protein
MASAFVADLNEKTKAHAEKMAETLKRQTAMPGVTVRTRVYSTAIGSAAASAVMAARACDLIVVDQPTAAMDTRGLILEEALFRSGRPVLVATPRKAPQGSFRRAVIAWDGSAHAARAAADALDILPGLEVLDVVSVSGEKSLAKGLPGADAAQHFARKGFEVTLSDIPLTHNSVGLTINEHALATDADIIVMGGFGHSRFREFLLGGATVKLTQEAGLPLLMAH